jgi:hypothetical protein
MRGRNQKLSILTAASYLLAVTAAGLFHTHHGNNEDRPRPGIIALHPGDEHDCPVCQFLAQKPAPAVIVAPVSSGMPLQEVALPSMARASDGVFAAWHSRGPPLPV